MAIADFFRTITAPYYLRNVIDEFSQTMSEIKEEGRIFIEEVDEIIHKENAFSFSHHATEEEMKTTVDLRQEAEESFEAKHADLLKARGFTGDWEGMAYDAMVCLERLSDYLKREEENDLYLESIAKLQNNFRQIPLKTPAALSKLSARVRILLEEPALPEYQQPLPDKESRFGITERDERFASTKKYLSDIKKLCHEMDSQINKLKDQGPCFSPTLLGKEEQELLQAMLNLAREKISFGGFAFWSTLSHLSSFNRSSDLYKQASQLQDKEQQTLVSLSLLAAALYLIISTGLDGKGIESQTIADLRQTVQMMETTDGQ
ncbi:MAG: hypothetical protein JZU65_21385 [Chlorobium sp.]|nr:hypothetical protein [Chlorobium sp.]